MTNPKIGVLSDQFDQGAVNTNLWESPSSVGSGAVLGTISTASVPTSLDATLGSTTLTVSASANVPVLYCSVVDGNSGVQSVNNYDLTDSGLSVRIAHFQNSVNSLAAFLLQGASPQVGWLLGNTSGEITVTYESSGIHNYPVSVAYDSTEYAYVRIWESSGTVYWDHSPDSVNWTNDYSTSDPGDLTNMNVAFYLSGGSSPVGSVSWADVNYVLP